MDKRLTGQPGDQGVERSGERRRVSSGQDAGTLAGGSGADAPPEGFRKRMEMRGLAKGRGWHCACNARPHADEKRRQPPVFRGCGSYCSTAPLEADVWRLFALADSPGPEAIGGAAAEILHQRLSRHELTHESAGECGEQDAVPTVAAGIPQS